MIKKKFFVKAPKYCENRLFRTTRNTTVEKIDEFQKKIFQRNEKNFENRKSFPAVSLLSKNKHSCNKKLSKIQKKFRNQKKK